MRDKKAELAYQQGKNDTIFWIGGACAIILILVLA